MPDRAGITVTPSSMPANGSDQTLNVNLPKPMSPEQQGLYGTGDTVNAPTVSLSGGVTVTTPPSPVLNGSGWLTGWTMKVHVPASSSSGSFQLTFGVTGTLTYLNGTSFTTGTVTYISSSTPLATIATTGNNYTAPTNYSFVVSGGRTGTAPNYTITGSITLTAVIFSTDNGSFVTAPGSNSFFRIHSATKTTIAAGTLVSGPTPVTGGYHTTIALTTVSAYAWGTPLSLGYTATDSLSGLSVSYTDSNTYNNGNAAPGGGGGGGGCPAVEMWINDSMQVSDCMVGVLLDTLPDETPEYANSLPSASVSEAVQWMDYSTEVCYHFVAENGAEVIVSGSTPVPSRESIESLADGMETCEIAAYANEIRVGMHVITDVGNGPEWSQLTTAECVGMRRVARLYCGGRNFAAGVTRGKYIYTHNLQPIVPK